MRYDQVVIHSIRWIMLSMLFVAVSACSEASMSKLDHTVTLRILHTSDVHGKLTGYNYFSDRNDGQPGLVHAAVVIAKARADQPNNLLIDNGDLIQGDPFAEWAIEHNANAPHSIITALNSLNYDVANLGNHEFNYGLEQLATAYASANFPLISSNIKLTENAPEALQSLLKPWVMIPRLVLDNHGETQQINIAVIGVVPPQIMQWDANLLVDNVVVTDMVEAAKQAIAEARAAAADVIVIAAHTGLSGRRDEQRSTEQVVDQIAQLEHVDAIVFGHQHQVFPAASSYADIAAADRQRGTIHGVPAASPGYAASHVGQIDLILQRHDSSWRVADFSVTALKSDVQHADQTLLEQLQPAHRATQLYVQQPVGVSQQRLSYDTARFAPSSGVQFVQRAQLWYAAERMTIPAAYQELSLLSAAAPFDAADDADESYTDIAAGPVSLGQIADLYRYPNSLELVKLDGQQLRDWLEASAAAFLPDGNQAQIWSWLNKAVPHYNFDTIMGLDYSIDPRQPLGQRIKNLSYQGQAIDSSKQFLILVNSYRASGGGNMPHLEAANIVLQSPDKLPDILRWYLTSFAEQGYPHQVDPHWSLCIQNDC